MILTYLYKKNPIGIQSIFACDLLDKHRNLTCKNPKNNIKRIIKKKVIEIFMNKLHTKTCKSAQSGVLDEQIPWDQRQVKSSFSLSAAAVLLLLLLPLVLDKIQKYEFQIIQPKKKPIENVSKVCIMLLCISDLIRYIYIYFSWISVNRSWKYSPFEHTCSFSCY